MIIHEEAQHRAHEDPSRLVRAKSFEAMPLSMLRLFAPHIVGSLNTIELFG